MVAALYATYGNRTDILLNLSRKMLIIRSAVIGSPPLLIIKKSISFLSSGIF